MNANEQKKATWMLAYLIYNIVVFGALLMYYIVFIASFFFDISLSRYMGVDESRWSWIILITLLPATGQCFLSSHFFFQFNAVSIQCTCFSNIFFYSACVALRIRHVFAVPEHSKRTSSASICFVCANNRTGRCDHHHHQNLNKSVNRWTSNEPIQQPILNEIFVQNGFLYSVLKWFMWIRLHFYVTEK